MKIFGIIFLVLTFIALALAGDEDCLPRGSKCLGENKRCCKGTTCMSYANRCVGI
uniref:Venom ptu1 family peptide pp1b n=1 Tax=Pristhesancus plagipennis TaxID=1955184 RepID=A0A1Q1NPC2_PRIPG|nr:venom ptu1 family peptide pp1b [Pristhesancus plagipennis]